MSGYERLLALARRELELVLDGRFAEAAAVGVERASLLSALPPRAPAEAGPLLAELERTDRSATAATLAAMEATREALARIGTGRRALRTYGPARPAGLERSA